MIFIYRAGPVVALSVKRHNRELRHSLVPMSIHMLPRDASHHLPSNKRVDHRADNVRWVVALLIRSVRLLSHGLDRVTDYMKERSHNLIAPLDAPGFGCSEGHGVRLSLENSTVECLFSPLPVC